MRGGRWYWNFWRMNWKRLAVLKVQALKHLHVQQSWAYPLELRPTEKRTASYPISPEASSWDLGRRPLCPRQTQTQW